MKSITTFLACVVLCHSLHGADEIAGFLRLVETPEEDTAAWDDPARFTSIPLEESVAFRGPVDTAAGSTLTASGAFWTVGQFVFAGGDQPRNYFVEITTGAAAGARFDITANSGNTLTVDLAGGSLAGVGPGDEIRVVSKWSLDLLFPVGGELVHSTAAIRGTEILVPGFGPGGVDFSTSATFQYRSDLGRWIDQSDPATDAGGDVIPEGALMVIRQSAAAPIRPAFTGFAAITGTPIKTTVNYLQSGLDDFANALAISGAGSRTADTTGASGESGEPQHAGNATTASVWFRYGATQDGVVTIRTQHSDFDTILAAYSGSSLGNLQLLASNDNAPAASWSESTFPVAAGQDYHIALDGKAGATGTGYLAWDFEAGLPEVTVEQPANTNLVDGVATIDFGNVADGSNSQRIFTVRNSGTGSLTGLATTIDGAHEAEFTAGALSATTLQPGETATFTVTFTPGAPSLRTAALHLASNDADENPFDVALSGTGTEPPFIPDPPTNVMATDGLHQGEVRITWDASNGATEYEIHRGAAEDGNDAVLVGLTGETEFTDASGNAGEGYFYFIKAKAGSVTSDISSGEAGHGTVAPPFQPDGLIGKKTTSLKGNNVYNSGAAQEVKQTSKRLKTLKWHFEIQNDGETADRLTCRLTRKNNYFKVKLKTAAGANVTAAANSGLLNGDLEGGETARYKLEVKPTRKAKDKAKKRTFKFSIASGSDGSKQDGVRAKAKTKK